MGSKLRWFKHYVDASQSESLASFEEELGFEGMGRYWRLLEFLAKNFDGKEPTFRIHRRNVREMLRHRSWNDCRTFMERFGNVRGLLVEYSENVYEIKAPILLELLSRDFKLARQERAETAPKNKEIRDKNKELRKKKKSIGTTEVVPPANAKNALADGDEKLGIKVSKFTAIYCDAFKDRYGVFPEIRGKDIGIVKHWAKDFSLEKFERIVAGYFSLPDALLVKRKHPTELLSAKLNEITVFIESGKFTTNKQAQQADEMASNMALLEKVRRGEI